MLVELSVMEQRYQAVLAVVQDGWKVTEVAQRLGVSRQSVHNWIARYERGGLAALADRSHRPASCPHQIDAETEAAICELRRQHPGWGPRRIEHHLARLGADPVPSRSAIYRCLRRHALIELRRRRKRREEFRRWERERPMQLWQMDVMGGVLLSDATELKVLTGVDDHSRFCVAAGLVRRATSKAVCAVLSSSLRTYGIPDEILTDNGKVFTGRFGPQPFEVLFDRICRENGISHRHTAVRSPTTTGKIERFHQSLRKEFLADRAFPSLQAAQIELDAWVADTTPSDHTRPWTWPRRLSASVWSRFRRTRSPFRSTPPRITPASGSFAVSPPTASSRWTTRCSRSATPSRPSSSMCSWTRRRSRSGARTTSSRRSLAPGPDAFARSEPTACTSSINRIRNAKRQPELDRAHLDNSLVLTGNPDWREDTCDH